MATEAQIFSEIHRTIEKIQSKTQQLQDSINAGLRSLPSFMGWIADKILEGWNWFVGKLDELWRWVGGVIDELGSPTSLSATADSWSDHVGGPVSAEVQSADAGALLADDAWIGVGADQYKQMLPMQKAALQDIKSTFTDGISTALGQVRTALYVFYAALAVALAALVAGIIGALASSATVVGLPAAPFIAGAAAAAAAAACWGGSENLLSAAASANTLLRQKLNDNTGYRDGHWPSAASM